MPADSDKTQIGIRLPAEVVRRIDAGRHNKTRSEYCRELIEAGLNGAERQDAGTMQMFVELIESLQHQVAETRESAIITERDAESAVTEIKLLRADFATAIVGILTKLGQVVREEDQRKFSREKAETFAKRVLLYGSSDNEVQT